MNKSIQSPFTGRQSSRCIKTHNGEQKEQPVRRIVVHKSDWSQWHRSCSDFPDKSRWHECYKEKGTKAPETPVAGTPNVVVVPKNSPHHQALVARPPTLRASDLKWIHWDLPCEEFPDYTEWGACHAAKGTSATKKSTFKERRCFDAGGAMNSGFCEGDYDNQKAIVKYIPDNWKTKKEVDFMKEIKTQCQQKMHTGGCPYVVKLFDIIGHPQKKDLFGIVMEYIDGDNLLKKRSDPWVQANIWTLVDQMRMGIAHLHSMKILHCDIKPENVMLAKQSEGRLKAVITDFGVSTRLDYTIFGGTTPYMLKNFGASATHAQDWFALVVTVYELIRNDTLIMIADAQNVEDVRTIYKKIRPMRSDFDSKATYFRKQGFELNIENYKPTWPAIKPAKNIVW